MLIRDKIMSWIKTNTSLIHNPKILKIAQQLRIPKSHALGCATFAWILADHHATENKLDYSADMLDHEVGVEGFTIAMQLVGWIEIHKSSEGEYLEFPEYETHNGPNAKKRAQCVKRVQKKRNSVNAPALISETPKRLQSVNIDKIREDKRIPPQSPPEGEGAAAIASALGGGGITFGFNAGVEAEIIARFNGDRKAICSRIAEKLHQSDAEDWRAFTAGYLRSCETSYFKMTGYHLRTLYEWEIITEWDGLSLEQDGVEYTENGVKINGVYQITLNEQAKRVKEKRDFFQHLKNNVKAVKIGGDEYAIEPDGVRFDGAHFTISPKTGNGALVSWEEMINEAELIEK